MKTRLPRFPLLPVLCAVLLTGCLHLQNEAQAESPAEPKPEVTLRLAGVERIEAVVLESFPVQVRVVVYGWMPDSCTRFDSFDQAREGSLIRMRVITARPKSAICAQVITRYRQMYPIDTTDLPPGTYTLDVNGKQKDFTLP